MASLTLIFSIENVSGLCNCKKKLQVDIFYFQFPIENYNFCDLVKDFWTERKINTRGNNLIDFQDWFVFDELSI